jgi:hypothetical protein
MVDLALPSLDEIIKIYITHLLKITANKEETARILGVTINTLHNKVKKLNIPCEKRKPGRKSPPLTVNSRNTGKLPASLLIRRPGGRDVSYSVTPEERDYYYNLDFLCGVYKNIKTHALDDDPDL